jgi:hypothetical protein
MVDTNTATNETTNSEITLFDVEAEAQTESQASPQEAVTQENSEPSEWHYDEKIKGEGISPEWFNHKTFKNIADQAKAYNEARKQITQYAEKLKGFSGAPESYEESEEGKDTPFAIGLKELGQKLGLNQSGYNDLLNIYSKANQRDRS